MTDLKLMQAENKDLKAVLVKAMVLVGFRSKNITSLELVMICDYIKRRFRHLKLIEINEAFELGVAGELEKYNLEMNTYQTFSTLYVSDVLKAYKKYKQEKHLIIDRDKLEPVIVPALTYNEIAHHTEKAFNLFKHNQKLTGAKWSEIYQYLKKEGKINIPKEEYKLLMLEIREEIIEEIRLSKVREERPSILLTMCLTSKLMFDCECLKRVVLKYFGEKLLIET
jgi:hypothetical protein